MLLQLCPHLCGHLAGDHSAVHSDLTPIGNDVDGATALYDIDAALGLTGERMGRGKRWYVLPLQVENELRHHADGGYALAWIR